MNEEIIWPDENSWTHEQKAVFINALHQPHAGLDRAIRERDQRWHVATEVMDERMAIQAETADDHTTAHALQALQEPDTPWGRHAVARAWLREHAR